MLHIVDDQGQGERSLNYISERLELNVYIGFYHDSVIVCIFSKTQHNSYNTGKWVGMESKNDTFVQVGHLWCCSFSTISLMKIITWTTND